MVIALLIRWRMSRRPTVSRDTQVRLIGGRVWVDDYRMPRGEIFWSRELADLVFEKLGNSASENLVAEYFEQLRSDLKQPMQFVLGIGEQSILQKRFDLDGAHAILIGSTGSGKTQLMKSILNQLLHADHALSLVCIDFKGGAGLGEFAQRSIEFASDHDIKNAEAVIEALESELQKRELGEKPSVPMVIAIDELAHLQNSVKRASEVLAAVAARGRSAKMHLLMTNQNLVGISRALLSNTRLRILIGQPDPVDASMLGQVTRTANKASPGWATAQVLGHGQPAEPFAFVLDLAKEPKQAREQSSREPQQRQRSKAVQRVYSNRERGRHREHRQPAIRGLQLRAHKAALR